MRRPALDDPLWLGPYRVLAELARGDTSRTLLGSGPDNRLVTLQLFADHNGFRAEEAVLPGVIAADPPWLATEFVPGPSLQDVLDTLGALPGPAAPRLAAGVAADLARLHHAGLAHGNLTPSAIRLTTAGARLIARAAGREPADDLLALGSILAASTTDPPEAIRRCLAANPTAAELLAALGPSTAPWPPAIEQLLAAYTAELGQFLDDHQLPSGDPVIYQIADPPPPPKRSTAPRRRLLLGALALVIAGLAAWIAWPPEPPAALPPAPQPPLVESGFLTGRGHPQAVKFSPDSKLLAAAGTDTTIDILDVATRKPVGERIGPIPGSGLTGMAFHGTTLVTSRLNGDSQLTVQSWDAPTGRETGEPLVIDHIDRDGAWPTLSADGTMLTVPMPSPRRLELWRIADHTRVGRIETPGLFRYAEFSPDGRTLALYQWDGRSSRPSQLELRDATSLKPIGKPITWVDRDRLTSFAFTPDGRTLITTSGGENHTAPTVRQWDTATQEEIRLSFALAPPPGDAPADHLRFTVAAPGLDDQHLLAFTAGTLTVHALDGKQDGPGLPGISSFTISPDRKTVATTSDATVDHTVHLWHAP
ncbi:protein kinase family protein [Amycolatopsis sp. WGS_07]|uniref:protein kinase family protein n=1 Tax=Amycolatopsis sp. WGS_07 TaxID=3076764 RepID=UPI003872F752